MIAAMRRIAWMAAVVGLVAVDAAAQGRGPEPLTPLTDEQVYTMVDRFVMRRAQSVLQLSPAQVSAFAQGVTRLQNLQRQHRRQRQRILNELRQLSGPNAPREIDEAAVAGKIREFDDLEVQIAGEQRRALEEIDQTLDLRQRGRLRLFLENIERQKLDLLIRARQNRGAPPPPGRGVR